MVSSYSLWVVPHNYPRVMVSLGMTHIPHINIKCDMSYPCTHPDIGKEYSFNIIGNIQQCDNIAYINCDVDELGVKQMIISFESISRELDLKIPDISRGILCNANTSSRYPSKWTVIE